MELLFSSHAVERMQQRQISSLDVEAIVLHPDGKIKQSHDKLVFYKKLKGRRDNLVAVVGVRKTPASMEILTVMVNFEVRK